MPCFAEPGLGAGIEYFVPRSLYWKLGLRWICMAGASEEAFGDAIVTEARISDGFPHEGQNCFEASLHILR